MPHYKISINLSLYLGHHETTTTRIKLLAPVSSSSFLCPLCHLVPSHHCPLTIIHAGPFLYHNLPYLELMSILRRQSVAVLIKVFLLHLMCNFVITSQQVYNVSLQCKYDLGLLFSFHSNICCLWFGSLILKNMFWVLLDVRMSTGKLKH